jgi:hypothetical protein
VLVFLRHTGTPELPARLPSSSPRSHLASPGSTPRRCPPPSGRLGSISMSSPRTSRSSSSIPTPSAPGSTT